MKTFREHRKYISSLLESEQDTIRDITFAFAAFISCIFCIFFIACFELIGAGSSKSPLDNLIMLVILFTVSIWILGPILYIGAKMIIYFGYFILTYTVLLFRYIKTICTSKKAFVDFVCIVFRIGCILSSIWITYLIGLKVLYSPNWQDDGTVLIAVPLTLINLFIGCNFKNIWRRKE